MAEGIAYLLLIMMGVPLAGVVFLVSVLIVLKTLAQYEIGLTLILAVWGAAQASLCFYIAIVVIGPQPGGNPVQFWMGFCGAGSVLASVISAGRAVFLTYQWTVTKTALKRRPDRFSVYDEFERKGDVFDRYRLDA